MSRIDPDWSDALLQRARQVRLAVFDVDGVMTDGRLYRTDDGQELKAFHSRDGLGLKALIDHRIEVAVLTARQSPLVEARMRELGIKRLLQGRDDKAAGLDELCADIGVPPEHASYMGDDLVDWPAMRQAGLKLCPADAEPTLIRRADWTTRVGGGRGAVREACELLLAGHGVLQAWRESF